MWVNLTQNWGDVDRLLELVSDRFRDRQELYTAYKVTRKNLVFKIRRIPGAWSVGQNRPRTF